MCKEILCCIIRVLSVYVRWGAISIFGLIDIRYNSLLPILFIIATFRISSDLAK